MSLINDALKQARKAPPSNLPTSVPPLRPVVHDSSLVPAWLWPSIVILLIVAAIFFIGFTVARHSLRTIVAEPMPPDVTPAPAAPALPVVKAAPVEPPPPPPTVPLNPPDAPKLQGIFYSPTAPSAIVDGKTIRPGDQFGIYRVKAISKYTVTLVGPDHKEFQIGMGN